MTPHIHPRAARRAAALLVAALVVGAPLVASAFDDGSVAEPSTGLARLSEPPVRSTPTIPDLGNRLVIDPPRTESTDSTDGRYAQATAGAHRVAQEYIGAPIDTVPVPALPPGTTASGWAALRQCESNGNYAITNPSGKYRGAYQFDRTTWNSVAERHFPRLVGVDPAAASPADQDAMAYALYTERGARPWPHCGRHLA